MSIAYQLHYEELLPHFLKRRKRTKPSVQAN